MIQLVHNRRAKIKGLALKEQQAAAKKEKEAQSKSTESTRTDDTSTDGVSNTTVGHGLDRTNHVKTDGTLASPPATVASSITKQSPNQDSSPSESVSPVEGNVTIPSVTGIPMTRRASLANGEAAKIESFIVKHRLQARKAAMNAARPGLVSPLRSPVVSRSRQTSNPYPQDSPSSPKISPSVRPMSSALHLAALRNNTLKEAAATNGSNSNGLSSTQVQLLSSGPFTPPRNMTAGQPANNVQARELSPIRDHAEYQESKDISQLDLSFASSTYPDTGSQPEPASYQGHYGAGPLPNPTYSFGSAHAPQSMFMSNEQQMAIFMEMQNRGRLGSMASTNTFGTGEGSDWSDFTGLQDADGFDPDARRASA